jgi:hypothetical protein
MNQFELESDSPQDFDAAIRQNTNPPKINFTPENTEQGLAKLVLSLIELLRRLLERQAIRRMESGSLSEEEIDRLGTTLMKLEKKIVELCELFGIEDLNINLGPLGKLLD